MKTYKVLLTYLHYVDAENEENAIELARASLQSCVYDTEIEDCEEIENEEEE